MQPTARKRVLCLGEVLWDLLPDGPKLGGAPLNFAYRFQSLGNVATMVSAVGDDDLGKQALTEIIDLGLSADQIAILSSKSTGTVPVTFESGQPSYTITPDVAFDYISDDLISPEILSEYDALYFGTLAQRSVRSREWIRSLIESDSVDVYRFCDINLRKDCYTEESIQWSVNHCDILKLNDEEIKTVSSAVGLKTGLSPDSFAALVAESTPVSCCVVTCGGNGAIGASRNTGEIETVSVSGIKVNIADTIGAGDAFSAGFLHAKVSGYPFERCLEIGNRMGSLAASKPGGTAHFSPEEILAIVR